MKTQNPFRGSAMDTPLHKAREEFAQKYSAKLTSFGELDFDSAFDLYSQLRLTQQRVGELEQVIGDKWELLCERCNTIHPPQKGGLIFHPCPVCGDAMTPTSPNRRENKTLKKSILSLQSKNQKYVDMILDNWFDEKHSECRFCHAGNHADGARNTGNHDDNCIVLLAQNEGVIK